MLQVFQTRTEQEHLLRSSSTEREWLGVIKPSSQFWSSSLQKMLFHKMPCSVVGTVQFLPVERYCGSAQHFPGKLSSKTAWIFLASSACQIFSNPRNLDSSFQLQISLQQSKTAFVYMYSDPFWYEVYCVRCIRLIVKTCQPIRTSHIIFLLTECATWCGIRHKLRLL